MLDNLNPDDNQDLKELAQKRLAEAGRIELGENFGLRSTSDFQFSLGDDKIDLAEAWLDYIVANQDDFPQYGANWESWLKDRRTDVVVYKELKARGSLDKIIPRTKAEAREELTELFGFNNTKDFHRTLSQGNINQAEKWLNYIIANKFSFPQYIATWDDWRREQEDKLLDAKTLGG